MIVENKPKLGCRISSNSGWQNINLFVDDRNPREFVQNHKSLVLSRYTSYHASKEERDVKERNEKGREVRGR